MKHRMEGRKFEFMDKTPKGILHPVAFGCRHTRGNKKRLHSHLGKAFSGDYAINKCRHMCFGQRFTWVTDCYALKFILLYDGRNLAILCLQMRFMCWDMDIEHCNDFHLVDADFWSWLGADLLRPSSQGLHPTGRLSPKKKFCRQLNSLCYPSISRIIGLPAIHRHLLMRHLRLCYNSRIFFWPITMPPKSYPSWAEAFQTYPTQGCNTCPTGLCLLAIYHQIHHQPNPRFAAYITQILPRPQVHSPVLIGRYMGSTAVISSRQSIP
jgi:hypothetical protein